MENDLLLLKNTMATDGLVAAHTLICSWNDIDKYDFKDEDGFYIEDP
jgi:hypothetical protein